MRQSWRPSVNGYNPDNHAGTQQAASRMTVSDDSVSLVSLVSLVSIQPMSRAKLRFHTSRRSIYSPRATVGAWVEVR
jgi:hypothetical protein